MATMKPRRNGPPIIDLTGKIFGHWTVLGRSDVETRKPFWDCMCVCGTAKRVCGANLRGGKTRSCGCQQAQLVSVSKRANGHGAAGKIHPDKTYTSWIAMKWRCCNPNSTAYARYGGRGITVCDRWINSFENFLADMGPRPSQKHSIDRIDVDGHYEADNCRWATTKQQSENTSRSVRVEFHGVSMILSDAIRLSGLPRYTVTSRIARGWSVERALSEPVRSTKKSSE